MVFPSVPVYLDPPNWNQLQQHAHQPAAGSSRAASSGGEVPPPPGLAAPHPDGPVSSVSAVSRSTSMAERARLAKIPQPEPAPNCPRCDSTNTKFCYFNNYSLSQPRHFCKTCRRYWTRGGALRNVPVGGGCRRNKRNKSGSGSSSKSTSGASSSRQAGASSTSSVAIPTAAGAMTSSGVPLQPQMPFLASLHPLPDYVVTPNLGLSFGRMQPFDGGDYQVSGTGGELENLRIHQPMQQLPFFGALETSPALAPAPVTGLFSLAGERGAMDGGSLMGQVPTKAPHTGLIRQLASVKMDDRNAQGLKFPGQYMGTQRNIDNFWNSAGSSSTGGSGGGGAGATGSGWATDLSGFGSSAAGDLL